MPANSILQDLSGEERCCTTVSLRGGPQSTDWTATRRRLSFDLTAATASASRGTKYKSPSSHSSLRTLPPATIHTRIVAGAFTIIWAAFDFGFHSRAATQTCDNSASIIRKRVVKSTPCRRVKSAAVISGLSRSQNPLRYDRHRKVKQAGARWVILKQRHRAIKEKFPSWCRSKSHVDCNN